jgi:hypothetical protein
MEYYKKIKLKDGRTCILRNCTAEDGKAVLDVFNLTHQQTDWMLTYPEEMTFTVEQEAKFLQDRSDSSDEIEILAEVDGKDVTAENERAITLYKSEGFVEFGRNPKGFRSRVSGWQELVLMRRELSGGSQE